MRREYSAFTAREAAQITLNSENAEVFGLSVMRNDESRRNSGRPVSIRSSSLTRQGTNGTTIELLDRSSKRISSEDLVLKRDSKLIVGGSLGTNDS